MRWRWRFPHLLPEEALQQLHDVLHAGGHVQQVVHRAHLEEEEEEEEGEEEEQE